LPHPADTARRAGKPLPHEVQAMTALLTHVAEEVKLKPEIQFFLNPEVIREANLQLQGQKPLVALQICNKAFAWGWKEADYVRLALSLLAAYPEAPLLVTYGPRELPEGEEICAQLPQERIIKTAGFNLKLLGAVLQTCRVCVSWDTGIAHLASALGVPVVDLFPAKDFNYCVQRWGIWGGTHTYLVQEGPAPDTEFINKITEAAGNYYVKTARI
jgi:ADP-heptose:LPS heptosyltransferase